jgi:DNA-binding GntR family transcriptional regulator
MNINLTKLERPPSLKEKAYQSIKQIILHNLSGGDPLVVEDLAEQLGISRTPVREALLTLETEGLVTSIANRGTYVAVPSPEEVVHVYQVRGALESLAVRLAAPVIPQRELQALRVAFDQAQAAIDAGDFEAYSRCDLEFHQLILDHVDNDLLVNIIQKMEDRVYRIRMRARQRSSQHLVQAHKEHRLVLEALLARDGERAEAMMKKHLENAEKRVEAILTAQLGQN